MTDDYNITLNFSVDYQSLQKTGELLQFIVDNKTYSSKPVANTDGDIRTNYNTQIINERYMGEIKLDRHEENILCIDISNSNQIVISGEYLSVKDSNGNLIKMPHDFIKIFDVKIPNAEDLPEFLYKCFGTAIISKREIEEVFGEDKARDIFENVKNRTWGGLIIFEECLVFMNKLGGHSVNINDKNVLKSYLKNLNNIERSLQDLEIDENSRKEQVKEQIEKIGDGDTTYINEVEEIEEKVKKDKNKCITKIFLPHIIIPIICGILVLSLSLIFYDVLGEYLFFFTLLAFFLPLFLISIFDLFIRNIGGERKGPGLDTYLDLYEVYKIEMFSVFLVILVIPILYEIISQGDPTSLLESFLQLEGPENTFATVSIIVTGQFFNSKVLTSFLRKSSSKRIGGYKTHLWIMISFALVISSLMLHQWWHLAVVGTLFILLPAVVYGFIRATFFNPRYVPLKFLQELGKKLVESKNEGEKKYLHCNGWWKTRKYYRYLKNCFPDNQNIENRWNNKYDGGINMGLWELKLKVENNDRRWKKRNGWKVRWKNQGDTEQSSRGTPQRTSTQQQVEEKQVSKIDDFKTWLKEREDKIILKIKNVEDWETLLETDKKTLSVKIKKHNKINFKVDLDDTLDIYNYLSYSFCEENNEEQMEKFVLIFQRTYPEFQKGNVYDMSNIDANYYTLGALCIYCDLCIVKTVKVFNYGILNRIDREIKELLKLSTFEDGEEDYCMVYKME